MRRDLIIQAVEAGIRHAYQCAKDKNEGARLSMDDLQYMCEEVDLRMWNLLVGMKIADETA